MITQDQIFEKYPDLYREKNLSPQKTAMCYGLDVPEEWLSVIDGLSNTLDNLPWMVAEKWSFQPKCIAKQVKIKFGQLRFYYKLNFDGFKGEDKELNHIKARVKGYVDGSIAMASQLCEGTTTQGEPY